MKFKDRFRHWKRKMKFNSQYLRGKWDKLGGEKERVRYEQIDNYLQRFQPKSILDLGCGDGVLNRRLTYDGFESFLGVDYAEVSVKMAKKQNFPKSDFETHDLLNFKPKEIYDAIILNEAFYYIHDSERTRVLNNILSGLHENGILIVSIFREGATCWEYFKENPKLKEEAFEVVHSTTDDTYWKVGAYSQL
ncbi:class I SAM-dependent methyltransferase [Aureisphaera galaxeae]|uniref:class I SAM-dependent methyltransferase n=1 Tax=Aureisphaera galaxeae TaxID=1538023 RepID=UPI00235063AE|nr:class I SAM-dependent methyltransferase [Aureisphaera galaxeae]MDC8003441.1 class I SAM-dependent methyltransferase [Aureisphaera galaxeae]